MAIRKRKPAGAIVQSGRNSTPYSVLHHFPTTAGIFLRLSSGEETTIIDGIRILINRNPEFRGRNLLDIAHLSVNQKTFIASITISFNSSFIITIQIGVHGDGANSLLSAGKDADIVIPSRQPEFLDFLDPEKHITCYVDDKEKAESLINGAELIICLDFNRIERTEWLASPLSSSKAVKVLIDHHLNPDTEKFDLIISDPGASSTCELLYRTLMCFSSIDGDPTRLSLITLTALATGILTDTNNFNNSVTPDTFLIASDMLRCKVDIDAINNMVFKRYSESRMRLMGHLLTDSMSIDPGLSASTIVITLKDREHYHFADGDSEGFVNLPLMIRDVEVSALFSETPEYIRVSLRSKGRISVNALANAYFNGGGHERAAGGRLYMPVDEVRGYFLKSLEQFLQSKAEE